MEEYAGRILAHRYRLPVPPPDYAEYELVETRAFDTRSGQEVLVRQVPLPEVVDAELMDGPSPEELPAGELPAVRRAIEAAQAAAAIPDHPRLDQVFDVFAEDGSLWIVSELVPARPLAALIADEPLSPYRAAEVASDVLTALRVLHAHGWTHRNITVRTVLVCEDGRVVLTGLAAGAAEEALCGYDPVPAAASGDAEWSPGGDAGASGGAAGVSAVAGGVEQRGDAWGGAPGGPSGAVPGVASGAAAPAEEPRYAPLVAPGYDTGPRYTDHITPERAEDRPDPQAAARAGVIAAYRAGSRAAAARVTEQRQAAEAERGPAPEPEPRPEGSNLPEGYSYPYGGPRSAAAWHGATPRRQALPPAGTPQPQPEAEPQQSTWPQGAPGRTGLPAQPVGPQAGPGQAQQRSGWSQGDEGRTGEPAQPVRPQAGAGQAPQGSGWSQGDAGRTGLPARLALPQGFQQADAPAPAQPRSAGGGAPQGPGPGYGAAPRPPAPRGYGPGEAGGPRPASEPGPGGHGYGGAGRVPAQQGGHGPTQAGSGGLRPGYAQPQAGGPRSGLDAERARQTRMAVVGAVTERWAPEQARSVSGPWQLAAPVGPATDLWALGALLFRAVQGHAPYPEDSAAELVELVCAEPPAFAEECGALRPVVESLLRQDPTERPDFEELRGWLRSLVRSAPEPDAGAGFAMLPMAEPDPARLPVVRRRGELHGRHRNPAAPRKARAPRALGRTLLVGILVLLAGAVAYAMLFMPRAGEQGAQKPANTAPSAPKQSQGPSQVPTGTPESRPAPQTTAPATAATPQAPAPPGYTAQQDPEHFEIAVPDGWERRSVNEAGQVRFVSGQFVLTVVPGRDKVEGNPDPAAYQKDKEQELAPYRTSTWSSVSDVKTTKVGQQLRATGRYTWIDGTGRNVVARNFVVALAGSYHVVMVTGPEGEQGKVTEVFEKATASYKSGG
ncbi:protein kinase [Streptomyces sp. NPDC091371]|uniref:protein kinase n=1 Tax=Streptomyces sp. NPDC091371 TaxID=3155303 RepID=UPI0034149C8B